ncbi:PadR family transcriptional regulator [Archaeoglobus veneficus]|uniref:Transcriptional regulator PadR family protein n=1 Tax=Archaeoglobus veneficus (strain DSM 11195 / SNP6) TaxID=693661 RepID=F2KSC1_ARCVS|nr:PadR family transcriptional regulator [Archaeoglobus veneficus]AEA46890.1 transcriptional regulator PadR family protein [Archaeoglobus veneficus SNP6]
MTSGRNSEITSPSCSCVNVLGRYSVYEILKVISDHKELQPSRIVDIVSSASEKTIYKRFEELKEIGIISEKTGINELGRPVKLYTLTPLGLQVLQKLEELESLLNQNVQEEPVRWAKEEVDIMVLSKTIYTKNNNQNHG